MPISVFGAGMEQQLGLKGSIGGGYDVARSQFNNSLCTTKTTTEEMMNNTSSKLFESRLSSSSDNSMPLPLASIEEEEESMSVSDDEESLFSIDFNFNHNNNNNNHKEAEEEDRDVYHVAVGRKSKSSMDALLWTLSHALTEQLVHLILIHVFPPVRSIPSPLGMLPKSKVSPKVVDEYMALERDRRRKLLEKYVDACSTAKVKVDIMLIESDKVAKAILDLIPTQNIRKLVVGTASMRKLKSKKGSGIASQILRNAPETSCDVKIICKGGEVTDDMITGSTSSRSSNAYSLSTQEEDDHQELSISANNKDGSRPGARSLSATIQDITSGVLLSSNGYKSIWMVKLIPK